MIRESEQNRLASKYYEQNYLLVQSTNLAEEVGKSQYEMEENKGPMSKNLNINWLNNTVNKREWSHRKPIKFANLQ